MGLKLGGGSWLKLDKAYGPFTGKVVDAEERDQTYEGDLVKSKKTGKVRTEWVLTFEVPESDDYPDGRVNIAFKEGGKIAIGKAIRDAGGKSLDIGGTLTTKVTVDAVQGKTGAEYAAKWELPSKSLKVEKDPFADDDSSSDEPPF